MSEDQQNKSGTHMTDTSRSRERLHNILKKKKKIILGCLIILILAFVGFIGGFIFLLSMILQPQPLTVNDQPIDPDVMMSLMSKLQLMGTKIMESQPGEEDTIILTGPEVNAYLYNCARSTEMRLNFDDPADQPKRNIVGAEFKDDKLIVSFSRGLFFSPPYSTYFNFRAVVVPEIRDKKFTLKIISGSIGDISLPESVTTSVLAKWFKQEFVGGELFVMLASEFRVIKGHRLLIQYYPAEVRKFMFDYLSGELNENSTFKKNTEPKNQNSLKGKVNNGIKK